MKYSIIITAGGIGKRMGADFPKQFIEVGGLPILMHTIKRFYEIDPDAQLLVTLPADWWEYWNTLCEKHNFSIPIALVQGGVERYDSVKNALSRASGEIVLIHDGVRPFVNKKVIEKGIKEAAEKGTAIPVLPLKSSLREGTYSQSKAKDRSQFFSVQTPQIFKRKIIMNGYKRAFSKSVTDDASLVEQAGQEITLFEGDESNIKITTPFDLIIAKAILENEKE